MPRTFPKDPDAKLSYYFIWYAWLDGDTIATSTITADSGITVESSTVNAVPVTIRDVAYPAKTVVTVQLSGGTDGNDYNVTNHIVTATSGEKEDRTIRFQVRER
jgi:hypothetical protein